MKLDFERNRNTQLSMLAAGGVILKIEGRAFIMCGESNQSKRIMVNDFILLKRYKDIELEFKCKNDREIWRITEKGLAKYHRWFAENAEIGTDFSKKVTFNIY